MLQAMEIAAEGADAECAAWASPFALKEHLQGVPNMKLDPALHS